MIWQDIFPNRNLTEDEIRKGLSHTFAISESEVAITDEITGDPLPSDIRVLCEKSEVEGDFSLLLSVYILDKEIEDSDVLNSVGTFCEKLDCSCLLSDDSDNPYSWILVKGIGSTEKVYLDNGMDDGIYRIKR